MKEPPGRERYLTKAEAGRLISVARDMRGGEMLADFIEVAVNTGCRRGELYGLAWSRVDLARGQESITLRSTHTKSGKPRTVPLNQPAAAAMRRRAEWRVANAPGCQWAFARSGGKPIGCLRNGFKSACAKAGIEDLRIHDLRHTAASWLVTDGVPLEMVKELLGHSSIAMTDKYSHLSPEHVRRAVSVMGSAQPPGHNPGHDSVTVPFEVSLEELLNRV